MNFFIVSPKDNFDTFIGEELKIGDKHGEISSINCFDGVEVPLFALEYVNSEI